MAVESALGREAELPLSLGPFTSIVSSCQGEGGWWLAPAIPLSSFTKATELWLPFSYSAILSNFWNFCF